MHSTPQSVPALPPAREYDLVVSTNRPGLVLRHVNRGVSLNGDIVAWTRNGEQVSARLDTIRTVRLQSGGDWRNTINTCQISFADAPMLTVMDVGAAGFADEGQLPAYRAFVHDLHTTLIAQDLAARIDFIAGYTQGRYMLILTCAILLGLIAIGTPLVLLMFFVRNLQVLGVLAAGAILMWPLVKMVRNNRPRPYDPAHPPGELME